MSCSRVDLPPPLGPTTAVVTPSSNATVTSCRAASLPYDLLTPWKTISGIRFPPHQWAVAVGSSSGSRQRQSAVLTADCRCRLLLVPCREEVQAEPTGRILPEALILQAGGRGDCIDLRQGILIGVLGVDGLAGRKAEGQ